MAILPVQFSLNAILMLGLGLVFLGGGFYVILFMPYLRLMGVGMLLTGIGCVCCGLTDGFTDPTPRGIALRRFGAAAFVVGVPLLAYFGYRML